MDQPGIPSQQTLRNFYYERVSVSNKKVQLIVILLNRGLIITAYNDHPGWLQGNKGTPSCRQDLPQIACLTDIYHFEYSQILMAGRLTDFVRILFSNLLAIKEPD